MSPITQARVVTAPKEDYENYQTDVLGTLDHLEKTYGIDYDFVNISFPNGASRYLILNAEYAEAVLHTKQKSFVKSEAFNFRPPGDCPPTWYNQPHVGRYKLHCFYEPRAAECEEVYRL